MKALKILIIGFFVASVLLAQDKYQGDFQKTTQPVQLDTSAQILISSPDQKTLIDQSKLSVYIPWQMIEPIRLTAFVDTHFILLKWTPLKDAVGYNIYRKPEGGAYKKINSKPISWPTDQAAASKKYNKLMPGNKFKLERAHIRNVTKAEFYPQFTDKKLQPTLHRLGDLYYQIALIIGEAYADSTVQDGKVYYYKATYLDSKNVENDFANEVKVRAGVVKKLTKPTGLVAEEGDSRILLLWNDPPPSDTLAGYHVYKATSPSGPFTRCDSIPVLTRVKVHLNGDSLQSPQYGFLDMQVKNYTTYYYRIAPRNPLGRIGPMSDVVKAMPRDLTPPMLPKNINITPLRTNALYITWNWVNEDVRKRKEVVKRYQIYKYNDYNSAVADTSYTSKYSIAYVTEPWSKPGMHVIGDTVRFYTDKNVVPEKVYWYRIACEDTAGNTSHKSGAISAILPDYEPPDPPVYISAEGFDNFIRISWKPPDMNKKKNKDLAGYLLYRGICGGYNEVIKRDEGNVYVYHPYPLHLLADITDKDTVTYKDYSVPKGSPICYRYALKAYDKAQNLSAMSDSVCQRLKDRTPPDTPVITALKARDRAIRLECVAAPIQDMKGFIVERSTNRQSGYKVVYSDSIPPSVECGDIPSSADSILANKVNQLVFVDKRVRADSTYWYRVRAFDHNGNKSAPSPPVSTFTFAVKSVPKPDRLRAVLRKNRDGECAVELAWRLAGQRTIQDLLGFVVYRSFEQKRGYRQISPLLKKNNFIDNSVALGMTCWYRVQAFDSNGDRSPLSDAVNVKIQK